MPVPHPRRHVIAGVATATSVGLVLAMAASPPAQAVDTTSPVIINEVYGGGGNSGAPFNRDFVELINTGSAPVDISTWSVQYAASAGTTWQRTPLVGSIAGGATYLIGEASQSATGAALPAVDVSGSIAMSGTSGKVALTNNSAAPASSNGSNVVDFVGYGAAANDAAGGDGNETPTLTNSTSAQRTDTPTVANTGNNKADFFAGSPTPKAVNSTPTGGGSGCGTTPAPPECVPGTTTIQDVQGAGFVSPLNGQNVSKVEGIVTAVSTNGFWMQMATPDTTKPVNSSGVFVYTSSAPTVALRDDVLVTGKVQDFYSLSSGESLTNTASLSVTEITGVTLVTTRSTGSTLPAPLAITPTTVPSTALATPPAGSNNVENITTVDPTASAQEFWEAHEGMLVSVDNARVVGPGKSQYGEIYVTTKPAEAANSSGGTTLLGYDRVPAGRVLIKPVSGTVPPANVGDVLTGTTSGPVDWSTFGGYDIAATAVGARQDNNLQPNNAPPQAADQLSVATYNVENLMPNDAATKYSRLAQGIVTNLANPDIISIEEIQDNSGATDDGTVAADQTIAKLVAAVGAAGGPTYTAETVNPVNDQDGGQPGGNIRIVFLYNPARVSFAEKAPTGDPSTTAVTVSTGADGTPTLSANPGRVDPTNSAWNSSRKPLAGEFVFNGRKVVVIGNHFNSKGGDQSSDGRFQPPTRSSEIQRKNQATVLNTFVDQVKAADPDTNVVLAGDFNDYQFSDAVTTLTNNGADLTDLINTLPPVERYTYNFNGVSQVLDHIFVSPNLAPETDYTVVHSNAEFADQASDHDPQVARITLDPVTPPPATKDITLLNFNDFHGRIDNSTSATGANTVQFAGTVEQQRDAAGRDANGNPVNSVLLSAGDNIGASLFTSASQNDQPTIDVLNAMGLAASAVGNHEFDRGYSDLVNRVQPAANWPYLGANVTFTDTGAPALPAYTIVTVNGLKVGVIGAVTQQTPSLVSPGGIQNLTFGDPIVAVNKVADQLTDGDQSNGEADVLVAEYHEGANDNQPDGATYQQEVAAGGAFAEIATQTSPKVAVIFNGHTHKTYAFDAPVPGDTTGRTRPIVQANDYGFNLGVVKLTVDTTTHAVTAYTSQVVGRTTVAPATLVQQYPVVAEVDRITNAAIAQAKVVGQQPVGSITADITTAYANGSRDDRASESTLGNTVANALRDELSGSDRGGAEIGVVNPGGLRAELSYADTKDANGNSTGGGDGVVTYAEANSVLPFVNNLYTLSLTGAQFTQVLEQQYQPTGSSRQFLNLGLSDNVRYTYDPTKAVGSRITSVTVDGVPLDPARSYRIGTFSFLAQGGDNFTAFTQGTNVTDTGLVDRDAWIDYLRHHLDLAPDFHKHGVVVTNQPTTVAAGKTTSFGVSKLDLTSLGSPANTTVTATIGGRSAGTFTVTGGATTVNLAVPQILRGSQTVTLTAAPTGTTVTFPVTVTGPSNDVVLGAASVSAGGTFPVDLVQWTPGQKVSITFNTVKQPSVVIGSDGRATLAVTVPSTYRNGTYEVKASSLTAPKVQVSRFINVTAKSPQAGAIKLSKTAAKAGTKLSVALSGFGAPGSIPLTLEDGTALGSVTIGNAGGGSAVVTIPAGTTVGSHQIVATAADGSTAVAPLQVK